MATKSTPNKHQGMPSLLPTSFPFPQPLKEAFLFSLPIHLLAPARHALLTLAFTFILTLGILPSEPELLTLIKLLCCGGPLLQEGATLMPCGAFVHTLQGAQVVDACGMVSTDRAVKDVTPSDVSYTLRNTNLKRNYHYYKS
ncbi:hypothetical protein BC827DRAFT_1159570 [Russula dissimulans]|nr:hypothetical protein BC827DRAFT_1159570 [Russula dissimulans]